MIQIWFNPREKLFGNDFAIGFCGTTIQNINHSFHHSTHEQFGFYVSIIIDCAFSIKNLFIQFCFKVLTRVNWQWIPTYWQYKINLLELYFLSQFEQRTLIGCLVNLVIKFLNILNCSKASFFCLKEENPYLTNIIIYKGHKIVWSTKYLIGNGTQISKCISLLITIAKLWLLGNHS